MYKDSGIPGALNLKTLIRSFILIIYPCLRGQSNNARYICKAKSEISISSS